MKTVNADCAAELIIELFKAKPWLNAPDIMTEDDAHAEAEAIMFLQHMVFDGADSFGNISEAAQRVASSLLYDLIAKFRHQAHSLHKKSWSVDDSKSLAEQALQIIAVQIDKSHPLPQEKQ